jgi:two-component system phosphate regulon sensor histidine kinase PhoR
MNWLLARALAALAALLAGSALGRGAGALLGAPTIGLLSGLVLAVLAGVWVDGRRAQRLMDWLRGPKEGDAPRDTGQWGELGYRMERALRTTEAEVRLERDRLQQFLSAIEASPNGVLLLDAGGQIEWFNSVAAEHFGLAPGRDRLQRITNLVRSPAFVAHLQEGRTEEAVEFPAPAGRAMLSVLVRPFGDGKRLVLSQDITARERAEAMRRDFVANVSHEIRTPLTVLSGFLETMASLPLSEAERQRVMLLMQQQTGRMQALVGDLLTLAQLEGSPRPGADRWVAVEPLMVRAQTDAVALSMGRHHIERVDGAGAELAGSEPELLSAVSNLLNNAVRYTPEGGRITLLWRWREDGGGELEVSDTGIGIAREHLPRLTERFYRVDGSRSRDTGGTGLGLSIVKHVVQRHGGEIDVQSEVGKGSSFRIVLPALRVRRSVPAGQAAVVA